MKKIIYILLTLSSICALIYAVLYSKKESKENPDKVSLEKNSKKSYEMTEVDLVNEKEQFEESVITRHKAAAQIIKETLEDESVGKSRFEKDFDELESTLEGLDEE